MANIEIERKYLIRMPRCEELRAMAGCEVWQIVQTYLTEGSNGETRRVRRVLCGGQERFVYTQKRRISALSCVENERNISPAEYDELMKQADPLSHPVKKTRYRIPYLGQTLEVDVYSFWSDRATLEIEVQSENQSLCLPEWIGVIRDVSGEAAYKNRMLARQVPMEPLE